MRSVTTFTEFTPPISARRSRRKLTLIITNSTALTASSYIYFLYSLNPISLSSCYVGNYTLCRFLEFVDMGDYYDFIVVGGKYNHGWTLIVYHTYLMLYNFSGGPSGCAIASRLARSNRKPSVLLLEAGSENEIKKHQVSGERFQTFMTAEDHNWGFKTVPQKQLKGQQIDYSRGRTLHVTDTTAITD